jgi:hypothetical protein
MTDGKDNDKDNIIDFTKAKKKDGGPGDSDEPNKKHMYYAVQPVIMVDEADRLVRLKYMTESGYLDLLGILNQIQIHNKKMYRNAMIAAVGSGVVAVFLSCLMAYLIAYTKVL